ERAREYNERWQGRRLRGAGNITMQCARTVLLWPGRSYVRKALEVYLAYLLELAWGKQRILEVYVNTVEWGDGVYGVEAAARCSRCVQNSIDSGTMRKPVHAGGRGTGRRRWRRRSSLQRATSERRLASAALCCEASAASWLARGRVAQYASASAAETSSTRPSMRTCLPRRFQ